MRRAEIYNAYTKNIKTPEYIQSYVKNVVPKDLAILDTVDDLKRSQMVRRYSRPQLLAIREVLLREVTNPERIAEVNKIKSRISMLEDELKL